MDDPAPILLVDDQPRNLEALEALLASRHCRLVRAGSADEALRALMDTEFAAIVLDIQMPGMDGLELAALIKQRPRTKDVPILFLTAHLQDRAEVLKSYNLGAVDHLTKPLEPIILQTKISVFVELFQQRRALAGVNAALQREVAEREAAEAALRAANEQLEERVGQRTAALERADRRKDEFLALLAHELRNPLAPIRNAAAVLRSREASDPRLEWCRDVIDRQVGEMARLLDDLLDVSRITRGRLQLRRAVVDLRDVAMRALETSRPLLDAARVAIDLDLPGQPVLVDGDASRLAQAISNLLNNSARYCNAGGNVRLSIARQGETALVQVRDDGVGIDSSILAEIFEPFVQGDRTSARGQGGLGIGLALVRELVQLHGGSAAAESGGPGQGSTFTLRVPAASTPLVTVAPSAPPIAPPVKARRILLADDNRDGADSMEIFLTQLGHEVRVAYDGEEAVQAAAEFRPEVAVLDIGMPIMDGYEVARRIRASTGREVRLIALTGWGQEDDRRRGREAGFDAHLLKPVDPITLQKMLFEG